MTEQQIAELAEEMRLIMGDTDNTASLTFINFFRKRSDYLLNKLQKTIQEQQPRT